MENMVYSNLSLGQEVDILGERLVLVGATNITMPMVEESAQGAKAKPSFFCVVEDSCLERCARKLCSTGRWKDYYSGFIAQLVIGIHPKSRMNGTVSKITTSAPYLSMVVPRIDASYEEDLEKRGILLEVVIVISACLASFPLLGALKLGPSLPKFALSGVVGGALGYLISFLAR